MLAPRARDAVLAVAVAFFAFSLTCVSTGLPPLGLSMVVGFSMYPHLKPGDLVVGVATWAGGFGVGDVVVYCTGVFHCVVHRVVDAGGGFVVAKGDYNPAPDPPVPLSEVKYRVVASIPLELWLPALLLFLSSAFIPFWDLRRLLEPFNLEASLFVFFILIYVVFTAVYVVRQPPFKTVLSAPTVELKGYDLSGDYSNLTLKYTLLNTSFTGVESCSIVGEGFNTACPRAVIQGGEVTVTIPGAIYEELYSEGLNYFYVNMTLRLDKGVLIGYYPIHFTLERPSVAIVNHTLIVNNMLPVPLRGVSVNLTYVNETWMGLTHIIESRETYLNVSVPPLSEFKLDLCGPRTYVYVVVSYKYSGEEVVWAGRDYGCNQTRT